MQSILAVILMERECKNVQFAFYMKTPEFE